VSNFIATYVSILLAIKCWNAFLILRYKHKTLVIVVQGRVERQENRREFL